MMIVDAEKDAAILVVRISRWAGKDFGGLTLCEFLFQKSWHAKVHVSSLSQKKPNDPSITSGIKKFT